MTQYRIEGTDSYETKHGSWAGAGLRFDPRTNQLTLRIQYDYQDVTEVQIGLDEFLREIALIAASDVLVRAHGDKTGTAMIPQRWPERETVLRPKEENPTAEAL